MATFTQEVKKDLVGKVPENSCCRVALCAALLRTSGSVVYRREGLGFEFVSENEQVSEYFNRMIESIYGVHLEFSAATPDVKGIRDVITFSCFGEESARILEDTGVILRDREGVNVRLGIGDELVENDCCAVAFLKGAFLGGGSCTLPSGKSKTGYHLEICFSSPLVAEGFLSLLERFYLYAKQMKRGEKTIVYFQNREAITDFFSVIGAEAGIRKIDRISSKREEHNNENRKNNCFVGNMDKTAQASAEQCLAIERIKESEEFARLDGNLQQLAEARLTYPMMSMSRLAEHLGISKSCLSHRMRKLLETGKKLG